jgi:hypothetical protein
LGEKEEEYNSKNIFSKSYKSKTHIKTQYNFKTYYGLTIIKDY